MNTNFCEAPVLWDVAGPLAKVCYVCGYQLSTINYWLHVCRSHDEGGSALLSYGRGCGVSRGLGVGSHLPVHGVGVGVGVGGGPDCAQYRPPVFE
jgi:hypothetical protein